MSRSLKKGAFVDASLMKKVEALNAANKKEIIKTWSRRSTIYPAFVEQTFAVYNGHEHITVLLGRLEGISSLAIGHCDFGPVRDRGAGDRRVPCAHIAIDGGTGMPVRFRSRTGGGLVDFGAGYRQNGKNNR